MSFTLDPQLPLADALRIAALAETDRALAALARGNARGVHEMRKSCKRLRAWARLLRDAGDATKTGAEQINDRLRHAAQAVGTGRDVVVAGKTFAALQRPATEDAGQWRRIAGTLRKARSSRLEQSGTASAAEQSLRSARRLIAQLQLEDIGRRDLKQALRRSLKRARRHFRDAGDADPHALHELRKRSKRLASQQELLSPLLDTLPLPQKALDQFNELLGLHHDLYMLQQRFLADVDASRALAAPLRRQGRALERRIATRGAKLFDPA